MTAKPIHLGDIVEISSITPGYVLRARVVDAGEKISSVELLDGDDPKDLDAVGPYIGDELVVDNSDIVIVGPAQGRGLVQ